MERLNEIFELTEKFQIEAHEIIEGRIKEILKSQDIDEWGSLYGWTCKNGEQIDEPKEIEELTDKYDEVFNCNFSPQIHYKKGRDY